MPGVGYNYEITRPTDKILSTQPAVRADYQPMQKLRATFKYSGWQQRRDLINGLLPGFNDTQMQRPVISTLAASANYNLTNSMFLEGTYGRSRNELAGCALAQTGTGPTFCRAAIPMNENSNRFNAGLGGLPLLFPDANKLNPAYYATEALERHEPGPAGLGQRRFPESADVRLGKPDGERAPAASRSRRTSTSTPRRTSPSA